MFSLHDEFLLNPRGKKKKDLLFSLYPVIHRIAHKHRITAWQSREKIKKQ